MLAAITVVLSTACATAGSSEADRAALMKTDEQWSALAAAGTNVDEMVSYWADDATIFPVNGPVVRGKAAIRAYVTESLKIPGFHITWRPADAVVRGGLGYTTGENLVTLQLPDGKIASFPGRYVTVWRKEPGGAWKCVIDIWNSGAQP